MLQDVTNISDKSAFSELESNKINDTLKLIIPDYDTASKLFVLFLAYQLAASGPGRLLRRQSARKYKCDNRARSI